jgi:hypothetical protein
VTFADGEDVDAEEEKVEEGEEAWDSIGVD